MVTTPQIVGSWVHAHERDHDDARVFAEGTTPLPPSRGRRRLKLLPDGTFAEAMAGADDRLAVSSGTYAYDGNMLTLKYDDPSRPETKLKTSLSPDGKTLETVRYKA